ncbi:single-stranded DNA-binding protein [Pedobacter sp. GSP4]|uniref:single-stranded DNA-binding protein n=1 Tax=Pedobacter sp. GSP4 TaxID=3453716 RepID=UPI003EEBDC6C
MENVINKVVLSGFAGTDVDVKSFGNQKLAKVNLAVHESYRNSVGEDIKKTNWFTLIFWNAKADIAESQVKKGAKLSIEGRLQSGSYEAKSGGKRSFTEIVVNELLVKETAAATAF